jgi:hypothetical protein
MPRRPRYPAIDLGPLPVELINHVLATELEPGGVRLSERAHQHIAEDHPRDYALCLASLRKAIAEPSFIGHAPKHNGNFEIVRRVNHPTEKLCL